MFLSYFDFLSWLLARQSFNVKKDKHLSKIKKSHRETHESYADMYEALEVYITIRVNNHRNNEIKCYIKDINNVSIIKL